MKESMFIRVFGKSPKVLVLDYLLDNHLLDFYKSDMARQVGISRSTLDGLWKHLEASHLITKSRMVGRAQLYKVNTSSFIIKELLELDKNLSQKKYLMFLHN